MVISNLVTLTMMTNYHRSILLDCYYVSRAANRTMFVGFSTQSPGFCIGSHESLPWWDPLMQPLAACLSLKQQIPCIHCDVLCVYTAAYQWMLCLIWWPRGGDGTPVYCCAPLDLSWEGCLPNEKWHPLLSKAELPVKTDAQLWGGCWHGCAGEQRLASLSSQDQL